MRRVGLSSIAAAPPTTTAASNSRIAFPGNSADNQPPMAADGKEAAATISTDEMTTDPSRNRIITPARLDEPTINLATADERCVGYPST